MTSVFAGGAFSMEFSTLYSTIRLLPQWHLHQQLHPPEALTSSGARQLREYWRGRRGKLWGATPALSPGAVVHAVDGTYRTERNDLRHSGVGECLGFYDILNFSVI